MAEVKPESVWECDVIREVLRVVCKPYDAVSPYSICVSEASFVVNVTVAPVVVIGDAATEEMVGAVVSAPPCPLGMSERTAV